MRVQVHPTTSVTTHATTAETHGIASSPIVDRSQSMWHLPLV
jgi:hypothetical protein